MDRRVLGFKNITLAMGPLGFEKILRTFNIRREFNIRHDRYDAVRCFDYFGGRSVKAAIVIFRYMYVDSENTDTGICMIQCCLYIRVLVYDYKLDTSFLTND